MRAKSATASLLVFFLTASAAVAQEEEGGGAPPQAAPPSAQALRQLRLRFEQEPTVQEVQRAVLRHYKVHPAKVEEYRRGAEWKALIPELEGTFNLSTGDGDRRLIDMLYAQSPTSPLRNGKDFEYSSNKSYQVGVRAHWSLDRLWFNSEILDVTSLVGVQEGLVREITSLYFTRRRLLTTFALSPPKDPGEQITESIRFDEITANMDALTGGWFSTRLKAGR
jgi:hypothetical protein